MYIESLANEFLDAYQMRVKKTRRSNVGWAYEMVECPRQTNSYDCAFFALAHLEVIMTNGTGVVSPEAVTRLKKELRDEVRAVASKPEVHVVEDATSNREVSEQLNGRGFVSVKALDENDASRYRVEAAKVLHDPSSCVQGLYDQLGDAEKVHRTEFTRHMTRIPEDIGVMLRDRVADALKASGISMADDVLVVPNILASEGFPDGSEGPHQAPHTDWPEKSIGERMPLSAILSVQPGTKVRFWKSHKVDEYEDVEVPVGHVLVFRGNKTHGGCGYRMFNVRFHWYVKVETNAPNEETEFDVELVKYWLMVNKAMVDKVVKGKGRARDGVDEDKGDQKRRRGGDGKACLAA